MDNFEFYKQLWYFYTQNRGNVRRRYKDLSKKYLEHNDPSNPDAFLRKPQFEALEMYVFLKEFLDNKSVLELFTEWRDRDSDFADASFYSVHGEQLTITETFDEVKTKKTYDKLFTEMCHYQEDYTNYIFALTMGLGKTVLMATCIFYEFLLANKYPKDKRFCQNALVFAPDKTVLQSLKEIQTMDKSKVVPPEYAPFIEANIRFHFLEEAGVTLGTIDDSKFNIIISNAQKIILKKKNKQDNATIKFFKDTTPAPALGGMFAGMEEADEPTELIDNQRFKKISRLPQLGVYVDEAHHLFGANFSAKKKKDGTVDKSSLRVTINELAKATDIVACYNYTGTPYVNKTLLPEVVYAYGLRESIQNRYLKEVVAKEYNIVKDEDFLKGVVTDFFSEYKDKIYEGILPKLAIFATTIEEATDIVKPAVERCLVMLGIDTKTILVNVGDAKITKDTDIRNFNNLDIVGTTGSTKQVIILVGKGREGWNCRSLFGVAMFRSPKSKVFVLQATMRCLRAITDEQQKAMVFLSQDNTAILKDELGKNFNVDISDLGQKNKTPKKRYEVRVLPPPRTIKLSLVKKTYDMHKKEYSEPIRFGVEEIDLKAYETTVKTHDIVRNVKAREENRDDLVDKKEYNLYTLAAEIARYLNMSPIEVTTILTEATDTAEKLLEAVNKYNKILWDVVMPRIIATLYETTSKTEAVEKELVLLKQPPKGGYYEFSGNPELTIKKDNASFSDDEPFSPDEKQKTFHASTYVFDSKPEKKLFLDYVKSNKVKEIYFTGMFTSGQGDFGIQYFDPDSQRLRMYYPDFFAKMSDDTYEIIEVKGDHMLKDPIVQIKERAARELSKNSGVKYKMLGGNDIIRRNVLL